VITDGTYVNVTVENQVGIGVDHDDAGTVTITVDGN